MVPEGWVLVDGKTLKNATAEAGEVREEQRGVIFRVILLLILPMCVLRREWGQR